MEIETVVTETPAVAETPVIEVTPTADEIAEQRVVRLAKEKQAVRREREANKTAIAQAERLTKAEAAIAAGDPLEALATLGVDPDDFYLKATDRINARTQTTQDPAAVATEAAKKVIAETTEATRVKQLEQVQTAYIQQTASVLETGDYPDVIKGLALGRFTMKDVYDLADAFVTAGRDSKPSAVLKAIQDQISPPKTVAAAPPADLISNAPPTKPVDWESLPFEEALAQAKAKHFAK
jgi:hypothetical protein